MGYQSSNVRCQEICRDKGYILAATKDQKCYCGNVYPKGTILFPGMGFSLNQGGEDTRLKINCMCTAHSMY